MNRNLESEVRDSVLKNVYRSPKGLSSAPAPTVDGSEPPVTPAPKNRMSSSGFHQNLRVFTLHWL